MMDFDRSTNKFLDELMKCREADVFIGTARILGVQLMTEEKDEDASYEDMEREPYEESDATKKAAEQSAPAPKSTQEQTESEAHSVSPVEGSPATSTPAGNAVIETDDEVLE